MRATEASGVSRTASRRSRSADSGWPRSLQAFARIATSVARRRDGSLRLEPASRALASHVIIHRELVGVRPQTQGVVFFLFHVHPVCDEVFVEDVAAQQERMIGLERFDCAAK